MNDEIKKQIEAIVRLLIIVICASLYAFGGVHWLYLRRFIAPVLACSSMFYFSRDWRSFLQMPFMFGSLSLGYGADTLLIKVLKRGLFGLANGVSGSILQMFRKNWLLVALHSIILVIAYILVGVFNPFPNARIEELFLGVLIFSIPILGARRK